MTCKNGHEKTLMPNGSWRCRECQKDYSKRFKSKNRTALRAIWARYAKKRRGK